MIVNKILLIALFSGFSAQLLKPILYLLVNKKFKLELLYASGGMPSSHSSAVVSLSVIIGLTEGFESTMFALTTIVAMLIMYDAANVRYYAGKNIALTKKLIADLKAKSNYLEMLSSPIYDEKIKEILGHNWLEVFFGAVLGLIVAITSYLLFF